MTEHYFVPDSELDHPTTTTADAAASASTQQEESGLLESLWNEGPAFRKLPEEVEIPSLGLREYSRDVGFHPSVFLEEDEMATWLMDPPSRGSSCDRGDGMEGLLDAGKVFDAGSVRASSAVRKRKGITTVRGSKDHESVDKQDVDVEFGRKKKDDRHSASTRARTAEIHNLSERRRRDRINEKMKALQELVPRCNKSDKASMLDDAIEYMKSLQLQVQMMSSMHYNIGQLMFPNHQRYVQPMDLMGMNMGMGMGMGMAPWMEVGVGGIQRPLVPLGQVFPYNRIVGPYPANLRPSLVPSFQPTDVAVTNSASNSVDMLGSNMMQIPTFGDLYRQYPGLQHVQASTQGQEMIEPVSSKETDTYSHWQMGKVRKPMDDL